MAHVELLSPSALADAAAPEVDVVDAAAPLCATHAALPATAAAWHGPQGNSASAVGGSGGGWWQCAHVRNNNSHSPRTCATVQAARAAALFAVITLEYTTYSFLLPFFPIVVEGKGVPSAVSGALFAGYALALVAAAAVTGLVLLRRWTAKGLIVLFLILNGAVTCAMTVVPHLDPPTFTAVAIVLRALQGASAGVVETAIVPVLFRMYPAHLGRINGLVQLFCGVGLIAGPVYGGFMYRVSNPYLGVGIPLAILGVVLAIALPAHESHSTLQHAATASELALLSDADEELATLGEPPAATADFEQRPTLLQLVRTLTVWTNNTQMLVVVACITFWETFGSVYLHTRVGLDEAAIFWVFCGIAVIYVLAALAAGALEIRLRPWARGLLPACTALAAAGCLVAALADTAGIVEPGGGGGGGGSGPAAASTSSTAGSDIALPLLAGAIVSYGVVAIACAASVALVLPFTVVAMGHKNENELSSLHVFFMGSGQVAGALLGGVLFEVMSFPAVQLLLAIVASITAVSLYALQRRGAR